MYQYDQPDGILEGSPGVFYSESGAAAPVALTITPQGTKTVLAKIPPGHIIPSALVSGANSRFYSAVTYQLNPARVFSVAQTPGGPEYYSARSFDPVLTQNLPDATLLGIAVDASHLQYLVTVALNGAITPVYQFPSTDLPQSAVYAYDGNYYGVSLISTASSGYVFRVTPSGSLTKIYNFPTNTFTELVAQSLLQASDGNLYGATATGGANGTGTIYKLTLDGQYTLLYTFPKNNNSNPAALIEGSDGNLYGATAGNPGAGGYSQLFRITKTGAYTLLFAMKNLATEGACQCQLVQGSDGIIYGVAPYGGVVGSGLYFALDAGLPKPAPAPLRFNPQSGAAGTKVLIWGNNLLSASVQFNGVAATDVSNSGSNYVWATVPAGATTGPITITTPGGTTTTQGSFSVQ